MSLTPTYKAGRNISQQKDWFDPVPQVLRNVTINDSTDTIGLFFISLLREFTLIDRASTMSGDYDYPRRRDL